MKTLLLLLACLAAPLIAHAGPAVQPEMLTAVQAHRDGLYDEALRIVKKQFDRIATGAKDTHQDYFITMFEWEQLSGGYFEARVAMIGERDEQVRRVLEGDAIFCADGFLPISRFHVIIEMNQSLQDSRSTYRLVTQLLSDNPALVRNEIHMALPAIVEAGDYALAAQYIKNPLGRLDELNREAHELPLYPPHMKAPRLAAELSIFMSDVVLLSKVLKGHGKDVEADELRNSALTGIQSEELRALATREFAEPRAIFKALAEHQVAQVADPASTAAP